MDIKNIYFFIFNSHYFIIGQKLVSEEYLYELKGEIGEEREFGKIREILDRFQLTDKALDLIGYKLIWKGLIRIKIALNNEK